MREQQLNGEARETRGVDTEQGGTVTNGERVERQSAQFGVGQGGVFAGRKSEEGKPLGNHGFIGQGYKHGVVGKTMDEFGQAEQYFVVLVHCFGETETWVEPYVVQSEAFELIEFGFEIGGEVVNDVVVAGVFG